MSRIACLRIPRFQIAVHRKYEPALKSKPLVLLASKSSAGVSNRALILMCSLEANLRHIYPGMKLSEARAVCADVVWRERDDKLYTDAQKKLVRTLITCSPKVTAEEPGLFLLDASGLKHLGGEGKFCRDVLKLSSQSGFIDGHVGIADSAFAAMVATRFKQKRWYLVPGEEDASFLAPLPIQHLPVSEDMQEALLGLGIKSMGQFAQLPENSLVERFGSEGSIAYALALGRDPRRPTLPPLQREFQCSMELGAPVELLNETLFVLKSMLDRLMDELKQAGLWADELIVSFYNDNDKFDERPIKLIRPSNHGKFLLEVVKLSLEAQPLKREFTGVGLAVSRFSEESWEQISYRTGEEPPAAKRGRRTEASRDEDAGALAAKYSEPTTARSRRPASVLSRGGADAVSDGALVSKSSAARTGEEPSAAKRGRRTEASRDEDAGVLKSEPTMLLLQRFMTRLGEEALVHPMANDQYLPEHAGVWLPVLQPPAARSVLPVNADYTRQNGDQEAPASGLVCRNTPEPIPVFVELQGAYPAAITYHGQWYLVKKITMPERLSGLWWERPVQKSYYIALIEPKKGNGSNAGSAREPANYSLVLLVRDHQEDGWFLEGFFD